MSNKVAVITGGTAGVGFETCIQLASLEESRFKKIIITSRSVSGGERAIKSIRDKTGCPEDMFGSLTLDLSSPKSCSDFVEALPSEIDVMVLNAGSISLKSLQEKTDTGVTANFHAGCIGNALIVENLLTTGKLKKGGRMFYAAGEVQRSVWLFTGFQPFPVWDKSKTGIYPSNPPTSALGGVMGVRSMIAG
jgi:NAD(P)-dependent dehydrogenase (short-subunit alcohol dehydrogenase family)